MDEKSMICSNAWVLCSGGVSIGKCSLVGEYVRILSASHASNSNSYASVWAPVTIGENCWIASCSIVVSGGKKLNIGDGAIVGAGSVVMRSVKPMTVVVGNPAKFLIEREFNKA